MTDATASDALEVREVRHEGGTSEKCLASHSCRIQFAQEAKMVGGGAKNLGFSS